MKRSDFLKEKGENQLQLYIIFKNKKLPMYITMTFW